MAIIKNNNSHAMRGLMVLVSVGIFMFGSITALASGTNNAEQRKAMTLEAEQLLANLGYWIKKIDGASDDSTRQAVIAFQKVNGLKRTGVLNDRILEAIREASRPTAKYAGAAHVEIDITRQVIFLVNDDGLVTNILSTSTGSGEKYFSDGKWERAYTPRGKFVITRQIKG